MHRATPPSPDTVELLPQPIAMLADGRTIAHLATGDCIELSEAERTQFHTSVAMQREIAQALHAFPPTCSTNPGELVLTIELTRQCNLACTYCYQNNNKTRTHISNDIIEASAQYAERACKEAGYEIACIRLIGGEPLISMNNVISIVERFNRIPNLKVTYHVDTNGCIQLGPLFSLAKHLTVGICLSLPEDHNQHRYSAGHDTTKRIWGNLQALRPTSSQIITLIYNTHAGNIGDWHDYLTWIEPLKDNPVTYISPSLIENYTFNRQAFWNTLSRSDYSAWLRGVAVPSLLERGWPVLFENLEAAPLCQGHQPYSCKVHADGHITICDAMPRSQSRCTVWEARDAPSFVNERYHEIKNFDPLLEPTCKSCTARFACGGRKWCQSDTCFPGLAQEIASINRHVLNAAIMDNPC